jgi:ubiquinone biosynthesis protein COQ9
MVHFEYDDEIERLFAAIMHLLSDESSTCCWSSRLMCQAEEIAGLPVGFALMRGMYDSCQLAYQFDRWLDWKMLSILNQQDAKLNVRAKIAAALSVRIAQVLSKQVLLKTDAFFLLPQHIFLGKKSAYKTCDLIWNHAGDNSTDFNYYSKRMLLLAVYNAAKCYYYASPEGAASDLQNFITNSLDRIVSLGALKTRCMSKIKLPKIEDIPIIRLFS